MYQNFFVITRGVVFLEALSCFFCARLDITWAAMAFLSVSDFREAMVLVVV